MIVIMCEKLSKRSEEWNHIYPFLEWLQEQGIVLAKYEPDEFSSIYPNLQPISESIQDLLYKYFEIDPIKLEEERRELLKKLREKASER